MSDARLRQLEREAQGDPAARVALLRARVRAGTLSQERLELAAYVGDQDARAAVNWCPCGHPWTAHDSGPSILGCLHGWRGEDGGCKCLALAPRGVQFTGDPTVFSGWARGLPRFALSRAAIVAARSALPIWSVGECPDAHSSHPDWQAPVRHIRLVCGNSARARTSIEAAEAWLACPCERHLQAWRTTCSLLAMGRCPWLPHALTADQPERTESLHASVVAASRITGEGPVREAIRSALASWALS